MNTLVAAALRFSLIFLVSAVAYADSAQWNLNPRQTTGIRLPTGRQ